jgi:hypothetical protein
MTSKGWPNAREHIGVPSTVDTPSPLKMDAGTGVTFIMTEGDVHSEVMGTAARASAGKPRFDLMPLGQLPALLNNAPALLEGDGAKLATDAMVLDILGQFQRDECSAAVVLAVCVSYAAKSMPEGVTMLDVLEPVCHVWEYGLHKYAEWNWAKGASWHIPTGCIVRHLNACMKDPDSMDEDSGYSHQAHMICNAMMLVHYEEYWNARGPQADSRPYQYFQLPDKEGINLESRS